MESQALIFYPDLPIGIKQSRRNQYLNLKDKLYFAKSNQIKREVPCE